MSLANFIARKNVTARLFGFPQLKNPAAMNEAEIDNLIDMLDNELSPENLTCDGELRGKVLMAKSRELNGALKEVHKLKARF
jgi:hypothetical protein